LEEARRQEVPPYIIFHVSALIEIARCHPTSVSALSKFPGLAQSNSSSTGNAVIVIVAGQDLRGELSEAGTEGGETC